MSNSRFAYNPVRLDIQRSRFKVKPQHKTSFNLGQLVPILCEEVLPGDTWKVDLASLVRMSTPIAPIMDNIHQEYWAFFVPMRLIWDHTEEFYGANKTGPWANTNTYSIPSVAYNVITNDFDVIEASSLGSYLGLPITSSLNIASDVKISVLPGRAYCLIWNEWFRSESLSNPILLSKGDLGIFGSTIDNEDLNYDMDLLRVGKYFDYFTGCLPAPQKGDSVSIGLTGLVPVITGSEHNKNEDPLLWQSLTGSFPGNNTYNLGVRRTISGGAIDTVTTTSTGSVASTPNVLAPSNLYADLGDAAAVTINQLRYAFQLQKLLERDARGGTRFFEMLESHFGVTSPDARLQRPEYLGGFKARVNIDQVLNTAGYSATTSTTTGAPGAVSVTGAHKYLFTKSFVEPGYLFILTACRQDQSYAQGVRRMFTRQTRFDFYYPEFANIGEQAVKNEELMLNTNTDGNVFGYQEAWAEYRYIPNRVSGVLNPNAADSLDFWTLANKFAATPTLSDSFRYENRDNIQRALTTGSNGPDFIADYLFDITMTRPMPMYSIPGLIDHH